LNKAIWQGEALGDFDQPERARAVVRLAELMSYISERCYAAAWLHGTEYVLWDALSRGPKEWGRDRITADDIARLSELSTMTGGWVINSLDHPARFVTLEEWKRLAVDVDTTTS
jgi:hypothetical protein